MKNLRSNALICSFLLATSLPAQVPEPRSISRPSLENGGVPVTTRMLVPPPASRINETIVRSSSAIPTLSMQPSSITGTASTFLVTSTNDSGAGTLRQAIEDANQNPGADIIAFQIPSSGTKVISLKSPLPSINETLTIDGTSDIGYSDRPRIQIDGATAGDTDGLVVAGTGCTIKAISITRFARAGILVLNHWTVIEACYIGVEPDGVTAAGNGRDGITIYSANNQIGRMGARPNVISGNELSGILIADVNATGNIVVNTYAGTNAEATAAIPNKMWGVLIQNATDVTIGGAPLAARNIISGNQNGGLGIRGVGTRRIVVQGNHIGVGTDTLIAIPNAKQGVEIAADPGTAGTPSEVLIGGALNSAEGNVISGNAGAGVGFYMDGVDGFDNVVAGNIIGLDGWTLSPVPNGHGIYIERTVTPTVMYGVRVGGIRADSANIVAGNTENGIWMYGNGAQNNIILGNYVGIAPISPTTYLKVPNRSFGVVLSNAANNKLGASDTLSGNVICANLYGGIVLSGSGATGNVILNNYIGTAPGRPQTLGNGYNGVYFEYGANGNTIGKAFSGNIIAYNQYAGIYVFSGERNTLRGNALYKNGSMGIDLGPGGITPNDSLDLDTGANTLINFPFIEAVKWTIDGTEVNFHISAAPLTKYTVDFYAIDTLSVSLFGEAGTLLGWSNVTTNDTGYGEWTTTLPLGVYSWQHVTAMMTDPDGNSSEFCRATCWKDADGDGLLDCWETKDVGMDINMDGLMDLDLFSRGARPNHKDLFVEVDHMDGFVFDAMAQDMASRFFLTAPNSLVDNPDYKDGINLHIEYQSSDTAIPPATWTYPPFADFHEAKRRFFGTADERAHPNSNMLLEAKRRTYRYCIFADQFNSGGSGGLSESVPAANFIISLGAFTPKGGTVEQQAGTFVHELGHNLGLNHGGGDTINYKPNYISIMNYLWCYPRQDLLNNGLTWRIAFSPSQLPTLNENNLDEKTGLTIPENLYQPGLFAFGTSSAGFRTGWIYPRTAVNWNGDADSSDAGIARDLNGFEGDSPGQSLAGFSDWPALRYDPQSNPSPYEANPSISSAAQASSYIPEPDMSPATYAALQALPPYGFLPPVRTPYFRPTDTSTVGGNYGGLPLNLSIPAPTGGLHYYFHSSDPSLLTADSHIIMPAGWSQVTVGFNTVGVERDTTVYIIGDSIDIPLYAAVTIHPASLASFVAKGDSGCVVTELGGFKKRFLAGCTILLKATLDGQAPPSGGSIQIFSSRPELIAPVGTFPIGSFAQQGYIPVSTAPTVSSPQMVILSATYRDSTRQDTVYLMPAPHYTFAQIGSGASSGISTLELNNAGEVLIEWAWIYKNGGAVYPSSYPGYRLVAITGMNDAGWISGAVYDSTNSHMVPAYWKPDTTIALPRPFAGYPYGSTTGINNQGDVLGFCEENAYPYRQKPTLWRNDAAIALGEYGEYWLETIDLNNAGQAVGTGYLNRYPYKQIGIRWDDGVLTAIDYPFNTYNFVNGAAIAADGTALLASDTYYFRHRGTLDAGVSAPPPFTKMRAYDINDSLDVVGSVSRPVGEGYTSSAYILRKGYQYDLACLTAFPGGWTDFIATSINNSGTIVGYAKYGGRNRYFMLTPGGSTGVEDSRAHRQIPTEFRLLQNYPNPFNPTTTIRYSLPSRTHVVLSVYNTLGQRVAELFHGEQDAGYQSVQFDGKGLASGVYLYRLRAGEYTETKKLILLR